MSKEEIDIEGLCEKAIETGQQVAGFALDYSVASLKLLNYVIERLRSMKRRDMIREDVCWNVASCLGAYLGEVMLRDKLEDKGFSWQLYDNDIPVLMDGDRENMASPISKVHKMILNEGEGSVTAFYNVFLWMLEHPDFGKEESPGAE